MPNHTAAAAISSLFACVTATYNAVKYRRNVRYHFADNNPYYEYADKNYDIESACMEQWLLPALGVGNFRQFANSIENYAPTVEEGSKIVVTLECNAPDPVLSWAAKELEKYADRRVIVATHQDIGSIKKKNARRIHNDLSKLSAAERDKYNPDLSMLGRMEWHKCHGKDGNSG